MSEYSLEDILESDKNLFSDPESEWISSCKVEEPEDEIADNILSDSRPESDRIGNLNGKNTIAPFAYEEIDF